MKPAIALLALGLTALPSLTYAVEGGGVRMEIIQAGRTSSEYAARGTRYVEARKGAEYSVRLSNQSGRKVAVALSVDGLNSIDGKHSSPKDSAKWVLAPWETVTVDGWQVGADAARHFVFTSEEKSYGAWLGDTRNLGTLAAAVFYEKDQPAPCCWDWEGDSSGAPRDERRVREVPAAPSASAENSSRSSGAGGSARMDAPAKQKNADGDYAATGAGRRQQNQVEWVAVQLEDQPRSVLELRYGFRSELVELGVLPPEPPPEPPAVSRRENASGFAQDPGPWCCR